MILNINLHILGIPFEDHEESSGISFIEARDAKASLQQVWNVGDQLEFICEMKTLK